MIDSFLKYLEYEKRLSSHTVLAYKTDLQQFSSHIHNTFSESRPERAEFAMVRSWIISLVEESIDPLSVNRKIACLRSFYKFLLRQEVIGKDPMLKVKVLKTKKPLPNFINEKDMRSALAASSIGASFNTIRDRLVVELFYATGIRLSELISLRDTSIDVRNLTLRVLGKRKKERVVPFTKHLIPLIKEYIAIRNKEVPSKTHGHFFVTGKGDPCYPMLLNRTIKAYLKHTTAERHSPHVLRHTYATHLLNNGAEINAVKDLLGHTSLAATQVYTHNSIDKLKKVFDQAHPKA